MANAERADRADATEAKLANEASEANEPAEPIDRIEPTEPIDRIDPVELIDRIEPVELTDHNEPRFVFRPAGRCGDATGSSRSTDPTLTVSIGCGHGDGVLIGLPAGESTYQRPPALVRAWPVAWPGDLSGGHT